MAEKYMILETIEPLLDDDSSVIGRLVTDKAGNQLKVKKGQGGKLEKRWDELQIGKAYSFTMGEFKGYPFVQDFKAVEDKFVEKAQRQVEDKQATVKNRGIALSYAKDLATTGNIGLSDVIHCAEIFYRYMVSDITLSDEQVAQFLIRKEITKDDFQEFYRRKGTKPKDVKPNKILTYEAGQPSGEETGALDKGGGETFIQEQIKELYKKRGWWIETKQWTSPKVIAHIKAITGKLDVKQATDEELINVQSDLQAQIKLM